MLVVTRVILLIIAIGFVSCNDLAPMVAKLIRGENLKDYGIHLKYNNIPEGLLQKPYKISFGHLLNDMSNGEVDVEAINTYVVGDYQRSQKFSNLVDPLSKYKDTWFGVYIVFDDEEGKGRKFMLGSETADPLQKVEQLLDEALISVPMLDQKLITYSTHQNHEGYTREDFESEFFFNQTYKLAETIVDNQNRYWKKVTGEFETFAAVTDTSLSDMKTLSSIRLYAGLPNEEVYKFIDPWHEIIIKGSVLSRYFKCAQKSFWAIVYYNGSAFERKDGVYVDNMVQTDLKDELEYMFETLEIGCLENE